VLGILIFATFLLVGAIYFLKKNGNTRLRYVLLTMGTAVLALSSPEALCSLLFAVCSRWLLAQGSQTAENKIKTKKGTLALRAVLIVLVSLELIYALSSRASKQRKPRWSRRLRARTLSAVEWIARGYGALYGV
jgi:hypothetical protein